MRIFLIHAVPQAIEPIRGAFAKLWPEAEAVNLLDDSLAPDRARTGELDPSMYPRFLTLALYAVDHGARGILFTCSAFGPAIDAAAREVQIPVLKPNEAMFEAALAHGSRVAMVATFQASVASMEAEFARMAAALRPGATLTTVLAQGARQALDAGDVPAHDRLVAEAAASLPPADVVLLAHFSTATALAAVQSRVTAPVLTAPGAAVELMRRRMG